MSDHALLPFLDAWSIDIEASPRVVWDTILAAVPGAGPSPVLRGWACVWGAEPSASNGLASHVLGAERPGFTVCEVVPPGTYALAGRHRFARYQVVFRIDKLEVGRSRLTAETFATFPGRAGRLYRMFVMDARLHALVMWSMVRRLRRRAERSACRQGSLSA